MLTLQQEVIEFFSLKLVMNSKKKKKPKEKKPKQLPQKSGENFLQHLWTIFFKVSLIRKKKLAEIVTKQIFFFFPNPAVGCDDGDGLEDFFNEKFGKVRQKRREYFSLCEDL